MADYHPLALWQRELAAIVAATETAVTKILGPSKPRTTPDGGPGSGD